MARTAITPTSVIPDSGAVNITALSNTTSVTTGATNGVSFSNTGQQLLFANVGATGGSPTATVVMGATVLGQAVTNFTVNLTASAINQLGPWHTADNQPGTNTLFMDFTFAASTVTVGLLQMLGVY